MITFVNAATLKNPETGKTWREENLEKQHKIPLDSIVEVLPFDEENDYGDHTGLRLFVVGHDRDCDGTPLYSLSFNKCAKVKEDQDFGRQCTVHTPGFAVRGEVFLNGHVVTGMSEENLKVIKAGR